MQITAKEVAARCDWHPAANSTIHRWHRRGIKLTTGERIRLATRTRAGGRFVFDSAEVDEFLRRLKEDGQ